jgi:hypothetical protein
MAADPQHALYGAEIRVQLSGLDEDGNPLRWGNPTRTRLEDIGTASGVTVIVEEVP